MVFDSEDEGDVLMDFLIYERNKKGVRLIDKFYDSDIDLHKIEKEILEGMVNYHSSLFEIKSIDKDNCILFIKDLLDDRHKEYELMDIGFSQTGKVGIVFYSRLIPIRDTNITSGVSFGFDTSFKGRILNDISFARFKIRRKLNSTDLFVLMHKKSKLYGIEILKMGWSEH